MCIGSLQSVKEFQHKNRLKCSRENVILQGRVEPLSRVAFVVATANRKNEKIPPQKSNQCFHVLKIPTKFQKNQKIQPYFDGF